MYHQKDFDPDLASLLRSFIARHEAPVCLIAHNGNRFDFPLMRSELQGLGEDLAPNTMCADSLIMFRDLDEAESNQSISDQSKSNQSISNQSKSNQIISNQSNVKQPINQNSADMLFKLKSDGNHIQTDVDKPTSCKQTVDLQSENPSSPIRQEINFLQSTPVRSNSLSQHNSHGGVKRKLEFVDLNHAKIPKINSDVNQAHDTSQDHQLEQETKLDTSPGNCGETESLEMGSSIPDELLLEAQAQFENNVTCDQSTSQSEQCENQSNRFANDSNNCSKPETSTPSKGVSSNISTLDYSNSSSTSFQGNNELSSTASCTTSLSVQQEDSSNSASSENHLIENKNSTLHPKYQSPAKTGKTGTTSKSTPDNNRIKDTISIHRISTLTKPATPDSTSKYSPPSSVKTSNISSQSKRPSYKLGDIYERVVGQRMREAHRAEDDCLALLRICQVMTRINCM